MGSRLTLRTRSVLCARVLLAALSVGACSLVLIGMLAALSGKAYAQAVPQAAKALLPALVENQRRIWPDAPMPHFIAGQIEQESCITLRHSKCWSPRAELKTSRENGIGLGQFTRAYRTDGSIRFDKISELSQTYASLRGWGWENRYDADYQLIAVVEMDKGIYRRVRDAATDRDRLSFMLSAYNGGEGGVLQDRRMCANTRGCDSRRWNGHVAETSMKSRTPHPGYSKSFFTINREYVHLILDVRSAKYESYFRGASDG